MRQVVEALRLTFDQGRSQREIARALGVSQSTISEYRSRFAASGLPWPLPAELDEAALAARLYPPTPHALVPRPEPDWGWVHTERKRPGMTLQQCWIEYKAKEPTGHRYGENSGAHQSATKDHGCRERLPARQGLDALCEVAGLLQHGVGNCCEISP